ncbi:kinesin-like protein [Ciborinia camelliae]|nr:kinesin-like protein [Ciborinia camelliae]
MHLFSTDVNSPMKPPPQNQNKGPNEQVSNINGRKSSISGGNSTFAVASPVSSRPGTRRRETSDSIPHSAGLGSPAGTGRFPRDEASPFLARKLADLKDDADDRPDEPKSSLPFGPLMRSNTGGANLGSAPLSPWGPTPTSATMTPMGTFGAFAIPNPTTPIEKRPGFGSVRGESRLAQLMPKDKSEDSAPQPAERSWRTRPRTDTDPFGDDSIPSGSAGLGGGQDTSPTLNPQRKAPGLDTPIRGLSSDFGMSDMPGFRDAQLRAQNHHTPQGQLYNEPLSPDTNPFRSPPEERRERTGHEDGSFDDDNSHDRPQPLGGIPEHVPNAFSNLSRNFVSGPFDGSDRSQTSSVVGGVSRGPFTTLGGLPSLSNIGNMGGWPTSNNMVSTPDRESRSVFPGAFGNSIFGPMGEIPSPVHSSMGGGMFGHGNPMGSIGRGSKLGSLFPPAMQAQMQGAENDNSGEIGDMRQNSAFGAIGRTPMHSHGSFFGSESRTQEPFSAAESQTGTTIPQASSAQSNYQQPQTGSDSAPGQLPNAQQRMMVMPDRMRWIYLDSQGQPQGPWSGLEMHDWYKASFFTADLSVKKLEDTEFEPLGQLIRRIGNSREPFLVPQIGIQHGPPTTQATPFASTATAPAVQPGSVQPPFAGAFPSFGTTLTAEQQNNLERRKQEEQYLMARQREFLAQQQVSMKQMQMGGLPSTLHHHSSAHSLQSQPSFGSMTTPISMPPQPPMPGAFFENGPRPGLSQMMGGMPNEFLHDDLARLGLQERQQPGAVGAPTSQAQQINALFGQAQQVGAQRDAPRAEQVQNDPQGFVARLRQFEQLRAEHDAEEAAQSTTNEDLTPLPAQAQPEPQEQQSQYQEEESVVEEAPAPQSPEVPSLTQQIKDQQAASSAAATKQSPISPQPESPWAKVNTSLPMPFPPPAQSTTPLPAPTAQRGRSGLPDSLHAEVQSRSETPEVVSAGPTLAPWAVQPVEAPKGPSLKEIQEAEAKKAAKAEEAAAAARRALYEQEMKLLASQPAAPAPGLPTTSTWGAIATPSTPSNAPSVWAKPVAAKAPVAATSSKKTLAEIQREEESRKKKLAATAAVSQPSPVAGGKRYADLASKPSVTTPAMGGGWSTVGAAGKVKIPTGPSAAIAPTPVRSASSASVVSAAVRTVRPAPSARSVTMAGSQASAHTANEEFKKWTKATLSGKEGLNSDIDGKSNLVFHR